MPDYLSFFRTDTQLLFYSGDNRANRISLESRSASLYQDTGEYGFLRHFFAGKDTNQCIDQGAGLGFQLVVDGGKLRGTAACQNGIVVSDD